VVAKHGHFPRFEHLESHGALARVERAAVGLKENVAVAESESLHRGGEVHPLVGVLEGDCLLAPPESYSGVDYYGEDEVVEHAAGHDQQPLPCGFRAELPGFGFGGELLGVHRFVDHSCNLHVAAERQPSDAPFGLALLGLPFSQREPWVEEDIEFLDADFEDARPHEVAELVDDDQERERANQLGGFYEECFHAWLFVGVRWEVIWR